MLHDLCCYQLIPSIHHFSSSGCNDNFEKERRQLFCLRNLMSHFHFHEDMSKVRFSFIFELKLGKLHKVLR
jgi:hypothetical protein